MKKLLMRIVINMTIIVGVYLVVLLVMPGSVQPHSPEWLIALVTLIVLVALDYLRDFIAKILNQKGEV